jgi:K+-sensing histidine kinase KdpD
MRSAISIPLIARDRVLGVLSLARLEASPPFDPHDVPLGEQLARQCAVAVDNARLYREPREAARVRDDDLPHIFERFHRGHLASRAGTPGTGLGLAIAGAIVEGHGGRLRANNQPGGGARIIVRLPVAASSRDRSARHSPRNETRISGSSVGSR